MGRVEQRLYRQQMARRRLGRMIVLTLLIFAAGALTLSRNAASHLTAETIAQPTATPIAAAYDQTVVSREITLAAETWYAIQTGVFSNEDAAREKAELLSDRGAPGAVVEDGEKWRVFIACYGTETDAASVRQRLGENQRIETYLYRWTCPELQLRLKGMAGQVDVAEAGFTLLLQAARTLRDTASLLDAGELTLTEAQEQITALDGQMTLWAADGAGALRAQSAVADQGAAGAVGRVGADQGQSGESGQQNSPVRPAETGGNRAVRADDCASAGDGRIVTACG